MPLSQPRPLAQMSIGILGGMSNEATSDYYRLINQRLNARLGGWDNGEIIIVSVNFGNIEHFIRTEAWDAAESYLAAKVGALERAGADVIVCVSNSMHRVVEPIMAGRKTPFIHIADPTGRAIRRAGLDRVGLLGTMGVMRAPLMRDYYAKHFGIAVDVPDDPEKTEVDRIIFDELVRRDIRPASKQAYLAVIDRLAAEGAQGIILGCTEIGLLIQQSDRPNLPIFDTTQLHVDAVVEFVLD